MKKILLLLICITVLSGCASQTTRSKIPFGEVKPKNIAIINGNIDNVWHAAISGLSKEFFVLDNIEKNSRIITLSYAISDPEPYVDCGTITVETTGGMSGAGTFTFPSARKSVNFSVSDGTPHAKPVVRTNKLSGKMNLVFTEISKNETQIAVNARFVLDGKVETVRYVAIGYGGIMQPHIETFSSTFNTGQPSSECTSKHTLEEKVINTIKAELMKEMTSK